MNIVYFVTKIGIGGTESVVRDLAIIAKNNGNFVNILTFCNTKNHIVDAIKDHGVNIITLPSKNPLSVRNLLFLLNFLKSNCIDIIHSHTEEVDYYLAILSIFFKLRVPIIMTEHYYRYKNVRFNPIRRLMYQRYKKIICVSTEISSFLKKHIKSLQDRCVVISNGIDLGIYSQKQLLKTDKLEIFCVARLVKQKDLVTAITALKHCQNPMHLTIIGDGKLRKTLTKLINNLDLNTQVSILGYRADIPKLLKEADVYVQSSIWEGCSIAILEAMALGLPLIVSETPGILELVGNSALTFPIGDAKALAKHLDIISKNFKLQYTLAQHSLDRVRDFSLNTTWEKHAQLYRDLTKGFITLEVKP